eukprot:8872781-Pyramimonas_sp.AAC.1
MALTHGSAECVLEPSTKESVRLAVASGWRKVDAACLPNPIPGSPAFPISAPGTPLPMMTAPPAPASPDAMSRNLVLSASSASLRRAFITQGFCR